MAATVILTGTPGLTLVDTANSETGWAGDSGGTDTEVKVQGTGSYVYQTGKNARDVCTFTPASSLNMLGTHIHLYWWMQCAVFPFCEPKVTGSTAPSGLTVRIESSASDYVEWHVAGSDTWGGEWKCFVVNIQVLAGTDANEEYLSGGTLDRSAITKISWYTDNSNSGTIRIIDNTWIDVVRFGTGLTAYGTDFDYADIEAIDQDSANMYGIIQKIDGVNFVQGQIKIDDNASTTTFNSTDETLAFRDVSIATNFYNFSFTGSGNTVVIKGMSLLSSGSYDGTRYRFDAAGTVGSFTMSGSTLNRGSSTTFKSGQTITTSVFNNCSPVAVSTATFENNTLSNFNGPMALAALLLPVTNNTKNCTFINNSQSVSVSGSMSFDGLFFDDLGQADVYNSNGAITITKTNGSNPNSYSGGITTFTAAFNHIITGMVENTEVTYVKQSDSSVVFHVEDVSATGTTTYVHAGGDLVDIMIFHVSKQPEVSNIYDITLPNANASVQVAQFDDVNYVNL